MQYFVGSDSIRDVYVDDNGVFQRVCNVNCFPYHTSSSWPSPKTQVLMNTEALKQTIYCHEAIFRNQVIELHRLYDKQRELMNELKSDFRQESVAHRNQFQFEMVGNVHTGEATQKVECTSRQFELLDVSRCKKYNNKVLDLQLLATEYMDDEDATSSIVAKATYTAGYTPTFSYGNSEHNDQQPLAFSIHDKGTRSASGRPVLFDLNEPFNFEEETPTTSHDEKPYISKNTTQVVSCSSGGTDRNVHGSAAIYNDINTLDREPGRRTTYSDSLNQDSNPSSSVISAVSPLLKHKRCNEYLGIDDKLKRPSKKRALKSRKAQGCLALLKNKTQDTVIRVPKSLKLIPECNKTKTQSKLILPPTQSVFNFRRNPIVIQALPCTNAPVAFQKKKSKYSSTATGRDGNKSHLSEVQRQKRVTKNSLLSPSSDLVKTPRKCKKRRSSLIRDSYRMELPSHENEECAPSDKNILGKRRHFYTENHWDTGTDVARIAAKALVFLSAADVCINRNSASEPPYLSPENPLHWFAEVVSDMEFATEGLPSSDSSENDSIFHNLDDFETMTLKLEDTTKEQNYCHNITAIQDEKLNLVTKVSVRATKARNKRSKKLKDFQGVILPDISSLSKHEVTEDLHFIKELIQVTGTSNIFSSKTRNRCSRGKTQSSNTASTTAETSPCFPLHLQNETSNESDSNERKRMMVDWGNITRRRRGQRYPASKLTFIQIAHALKAH